MIVSTDALQKSAIGNDAGWLLTFHRENNDAIQDEPVLSISRSQYYAEIDATLPSGLEGGSYTFTIEGMIDSHYRAIAQNPSTADPPTVVKLYLFWRDTNRSVGGYLANVAGLTDLTSNVTQPPEDALVAVLSITKVTRRVGSRQYEAVIHARERVFDRLSRKVIQSICIEPATLLSRIQEQTGIEIITFAELANGNFPNSETVNLGAAPFSIEQGNSYRQEITELAQALEKVMNQHGRGMLLIRNGVLYFGSRDIPLTSARESPTAVPQLLMDNIKSLTAGNGLVNIAALDSQVSDPFADQDSLQANPQRPQFELTLKGRPDIKPGDVVKFELPEEELGSLTPGIGEAIAGSLAGPFGTAITAAVTTSEATEKNLYVSSVRHQLGRTRGFTTIVTGVVIEDLSEPWDRPSDRGSRPQTEESFTAAADGTTQAAHAVRRVSQQALQNQRLTEVGEVRQTHLTGAGSADESPAQTLKLWGGLAQPDGHPNQANRLPIRRENPTILDSVAYASPFAWGKCGLVLPRYPGTRVVMTYRNGQKIDPVEIGALWEAGQAPDSQPGDWWLILPVGVPEEERETIGDDIVPETHTGQVTHDLIDADGNRIIEVGELTIRIGRDSLKNAGERPERSSDEDSITIEHADAGSRVVMKPNGSVVITAKNIELNTRDESGDITLNAKTVNINADDVKVSVTNAMDVR